MPFAHLRYARKGSKHLKKNVAIRPVKDSKRANAKDKKEAIPVPVGVHALVSN
eukprot:CAMPEP_0203757286 /NCGR_PEP_ID=MMETSP0098-20131031/10409_1 /ASSEMBLY_ACC=CAM_ASM_000208 /TAXON_ID=96639 /ORGANISM=" , Strain NY0313808BC1" /LENGTH=52 /DNA_ID=CAMNT_0050649479 /DNA_START=66 /DNA_END=224 /DNA_ORIENTATION=+